MSTAIKKTGTVILALLACIAMAFALTSCGGSQSSSSSSQASSSAAKDSVKIAIVQLADNSAFDEMSSAFKAELANQGYVEGQNVTYDMKSAQGDSSTLQTICGNLSSEGYDLVVGIVTPATQAVVNANPGCPVVFISVANPVGSGIMSSMDTPDKNATGTSNVIPVDQIFTLADQLTPNYGTVGLLYCSGENNAVLTVQKAKEYLDKQGIPYVEQSVANSAEVQQAAQSLASKCGMIYIPVDSTVQSAMPQVVEAATAAKIPVYGSDPVMVKSGALACISVSNTQLGTRSAQMAAQILSGTPVSEIPAEALTDYQYVINGQTAATLGVTVPTGDQYKVIGQ